MNKVLATRNVLPVASWSVFVVSCIQDLNIVNNFERTGLSFFDFFLPTTGVQSPPFHSGPCCYNFLFVNKQPPVNAFEHFCSSYVPVKNVDSGSVVANVAGLP